MTWTPLAERLDSLPKVICGPIVRRVEHNSASVWIAFKEEVSDLRLDVFDGLSSSEQRVLTGTSSTIALGDHLHVAVVTATPDGGRILQPEKIYSYNIFFGSSSLTSPGVLNHSGNSGSGIEKITLGNYELPTFMLPAENIDHLVIAHGSCRKPHGGSSDAIEALSKVLDSKKDSVLERPQQLYLTGDQIYADDVADVILFMANDAINEILGWTETLPGPPPPDKLEYHNRSETIKNQIAFTSDAAKSHLITLGEYYIMYLLAWSDVLWWTDAPEFEVVFPGKPTEETISISGSPSTNSTHLYRCYIKETNLVGRFRQSVLSFQRVVANIATYMVFDDHEITDDWFLNREWSEDSLSENTLPRRVMANGMGAFAAFQGWGNLPSSFAKRAGLPDTEQSDYWKILNQLTVIHNSAGLEGFTELESMVLPVVNPAQNGWKELKPVVSWEYIIDFPAFSLVGLDTRTRRGFFSRKGAASLIVPTQFENQIPAERLKVPSVGNINKKINIVLSGAPVIGHTFMEEVVQPLFTALAGESFADYEAWAFQGFTFELLIQRLAYIAPVIVLSGDVHYGFSAKTEYWDERTAGQEFQGTVVQLCSSAFSNSDTKTNLIANKCFDPEEGKYLGWNKSYPMFKYANQFEPGTSHTYMVPFRNPPGPAVRKLNPGDRYIDKPDWRYRIQFIKDGRTESERGVPEPSTLSGPEEASAAALHRHYSDWDKHRTVVGRDNFGVVQFQDAGSVKVTHSLWYSPKEEQVSSQDYGEYTVHEISLESPSEDSRPGKPV